MKPSVQGSYLETEVMTATPQKLQLMLIDGAIRFIERTKLHWGKDENEEACETLIRAQQIVTELLTSLDRDVCPELVRKVASVYLFIFRSLMTAGMEHDEKKLDDAIGILVIQRETWQNMCEQLTKEGSANDVVISSDAKTPTTPSPVVEQNTTGGMTSGFSLEA